MPVLDPHAPTVQVSVPVPQPVPPRRPRPQPVPRGGVAPALAPVPPGMTPQQPQPLPTAVILPDMPDERPARQLPRRRVAMARPGPVVRYRDTPARASPRVVGGEPAPAKGTWTPLYPDFAVSPEQGVDESPREGGSEWEDAPGPSHVKGWKLQDGGFVRKFHGPAVGRAGTAEVLHVKFKGKKGGKESEYEYYFDGDEGEDWLDRLRGASAPGKVVWQMIRAEVPYKRVYRRLARRVVAIDGPVRNARENLDNRYSWLSPEGEFHPIPSAMGNTHELWSIRHGLGSLDKQFRAGWHRITFVGGDLLANNPHAPPTRAQRHALKDLAITHKMGRVLHDDDETERVIYSNPDAPTHLSRSGGRPRQDPLADPPPG